MWTTDFDYVYNVVMSKTITKTFNDKTIRGIYDINLSSYFFSATDIVSILVNTKNSRKYWNTLKSRKEELMSISYSHKLMSIDNKVYMSDTLNIEGIQTLNNYIKSCMCGQLISFLNANFKKNFSMEEQLIEVINVYASSLDLLDSYDHQTLTKPKGNKAIYQLTYDNALEIINSMKFKDSSSLFGVEKEKGKLNGILVAVHQEVFGEEIYPSLEEKAAHLLYFLVKDHPFVDGCKRIAATLFLEFLNKNHALIKNGELVISPKALVAITVLVAESNPIEMDMIIKLIMNLIV